MITPNRTELGLIAQDVEPVFPDLVETDPTGMRSMNYVGLISPMIGAIKEQQAESANYGPGWRSPSLPPWSRASCCGASGRPGPGSSRLSPPRAEGVAAVR